MTELRPSRDKALAWLAFIGVLILIAFTPLMAVGNWLTGRRANRKRHEEQMRRYRMRRAALERR